MALVRKRETILVNSTGRAYVGVRVRAFLGDIEQQLYADDVGTPLGIAETNANGEYDFWIEEGVYDLTYSLAGVPLGDEDGADIFEVARKSYLDTSAKDFGARGDGATFDTTALSSALTAATGRVVKLTGVGAKYLTSTSFYGYLNCRFEGSGQLVMGGKGQARNRAFITNEVADPDYSALENYFDGDWSKQIETNFTFVGADVGATPISHYRLMDRAAQHSSIFVNAGGLNTQPDDQAGGRTGMFREHVRLFQGGQGDLMGRFTFAQAYGTRPGATHYLSCPAVSLQGADIQGLADGNYLQAHEINFHDEGHAVAVGNVVNYHRSNAGAGLYQTWKHDNVQSVGSQPIDIVYSLSGPAKRYIDVSNATLTDGSVIAMKRGQRIHLDAVSNNDPIGINRGATVNDTWIGADADGNVVVNLSSGKTHIIPGNTSYFAGPSATRRTTLIDRANWYAPEDFLEPGVVPDANFDWAPLILLALTKAVADEKEGVMLGPKTYGVKKSGMSTADPNKGVGLLIPDMVGVKLWGSGSRTVLKRIAADDYHVIEVMRADRAAIQWMTIDQNATALPVHGTSDADRDANACHCFSLNSGSTGSVTDFTYSHIWHRDSQGYGAGLQFGNYSKISLNNLYFDGHNWDGIDIKHRAAAPGPFVNEAIMGFNWFARYCGRNKADNVQVCFDIRGPFIGYGFFGTLGGASCIGVMRQRGGMTGDSSFGGQKSQIKGVHAKHTGTGFTATCYGMICESDLASMEGVSEGPFTCGAMIGATGVATKVQLIDLDIVAEGSVFAGLRIFAAAQGNSVKVRSKGSTHGIYCEGKNNNIEFIGLDSVTNHIRFVAGANDNNVVARQYLGTTPGGTGGNYRNDGTGNVGM